MTLKLCSIAAALALAFTTAAQAQQTRDPTTNDAPKGSATSGATSPGTTK